MKKNIVVIGLLLLMSLSACTFNVSRSGDGGLLINTGIPEAVIRQVIQVALNQDIQLKSLEVDLKPGYFDVKGVRDNQDGSGEYELTFSVVLGAAEGRPTVVISNAVGNGIAIEQSMVDQWNTRIADGIKDFADQTPNASLEMVTVTEEAITLALKVKR